MITFNLFGHNVSLFKKSSDGGKNSGVTGYWLIECKSLFSIVLLKFQPNNRENFHSHAFNAYTWWLSGLVLEHFPTGEVLTWFPNLMPKHTPRSNTHKIQVLLTAWAFSVRGPWQDQWTEVTPGGETITLTHGRKRVDK